MPEEKWRWPRARAVSLPWDFCLKKNLSDGPFTSTADKTRLCPSAVFEEDEKLVKMKAHTEKVRLSCWPWSCSSGWLIYFNGKWLILTNRSVTPQHKTCPPPWHLTCEGKKRSLEWDKQRAELGKQKMELRCTLSLGVMYSPSVHLSGKGRRCVCNVIHLWAV